ncbi:putative ribonuclease H-like domain-containing protein [Tanacetum coccineum]
MWRSIKKGPYVRPMIPDLDDTTEQILEPLSKMTDINKKQYIADVKEQIKRLMYGSDVTNHVRHLRLMDEFDKFAAKEGESLESVYERLTKLMNIMDCNNVRPILVSINTKFFNCLQPEWSKYVTMVRHNQTGDTVSYDQLYDSLVQFEPHVHASKAKRAARNHDTLALIAHSNASSLQSHASPSYSHSPQPYYVTHPSSVVDYEEVYQGELQRDSQEDNLTTAMMMVELTYEPRMQDMVKMRVPRTESNTGKANVQCYNCNEKGHYARDCKKQRVCDAKYFREQMLLAIKDEVKSNLNDEENDFKLDNSYGDETLEELTAALIMMAQIQPADDNAVTEPTYDAKADSEVNALHKRVHEHKNHGKRKTIINRSAADQIDSNIIFDYPYVENNGGSDEHYSNDHDQYHDVKILAYNALREAENKKRLNNELKKQKELLQKELETCKERVKTFESKTIQCSKYKETCDELEREIRADKDTIEIILKEKDKIETGLAYQNLERLKKAIAAQPKMYHGEMLQSTKLKIDSPDFEETLEDAEESRLKMRNKMVQLYYGKLNALYETFVPQKESSVEQTYFSISSTSNICSESNEVK